MKITTKQDSRYKHRLLVLSCSARKHKTLGEIPAWELYDGVAFRIIKKLQRKKNYPVKTDLVIISAKYGLVRPETVISYYDLRMTPQIASQQSVHNISILKMLVRDNKYDEICVCAGQDYILAVQPISEWLPEAVPLIVPGGKIGQKLQQMKQWLLSVDYIEGHQGPTT